MQDFRFRRAILNLLNLCAQDFAVYSVVSRIQAVLDPAEIAFQKRKVSSLLSTQGPYQHGDEGRWGGGGVVLDEGIVERWPWDSITRKLGTMTECGPPQAALVPHLRISESLIIQAIRASYWEDLGLLLARL